MASPTLSLSASRFTIPSTVQRLPQDSSSWHSHRVQVLNNRPLKQSAFIRTISCTAASTSLQNETSPSGGSKPSQSSGRQLASIPAVPLPTEGPTAAPDWVKEAVRKQPWKGGLEPSGERSYTVDRDEIEGQIPPELEGTLYRCGPGRIRIDGTPLGHWFDGDGMVYAAKISGPSSSSSVSFCCRWVQTPLFRARQQRGRDEITAKGAWTAASSVWSNIGIPGNPSNTSIISFGGKVLSLCEGGKPFEVDPVTLETISAVDFNLPCFFSAHPNIDPVTGELFNHGLNNGAESLRSFHPFAISPSGKVRIGPPISTRATTFVHDAAISEHFIVFVISPYVVDDPLVPVLSILGIKELGNEFHFRDASGTRVIVVSKDTLQVVRDITVESFSSYHFCNAYEEDGKLHVLVNKLDGPRESLENVFKNMYGGSWQRQNLNTLWRYQWDLATWQLLSSEPAMAKNLNLSSDVFGMEFPQINPKFVGRKNRFVYVLGTDPNRALGEPEYLNSVQKYDLDTGKVFTHTFPPWHYVNEGSFVAKEGAVDEDDGYFVLFVYEAPRHASSIVVLDAKDVSLPPIARVPLKSHVPYYFHGTFVPSS